MCAKTIKRNETFPCGNCGLQVPVAQKSCRNHCCYCLWSLHVDGDVPGDRDCSCHGLMEPYKIETSAKGYVIHHRCEKCKEIKKNKAAPDDDWDKIIELSQFG